MSELVKELTLGRLQQLVREAGPDGLPVCAAKDVATSLTKGRWYAVRLTSAGELVFHDDFSIPVYLNTAEDWERFEPIVDSQQVASEMVDHRGRLEHRVMGLMEVLGRLPKQEVKLQAGDIVVRKDPTDGLDDRPYVIAKMLDRDEQKLTAQVMQTLAAHDILAYHNYNGPCVSILASHSVERIGSLREWGLGELDPELIERLTVFDMPEYLKR